MFHGVKEGICFKSNRMKCFSTPIGRSETSDQNEWQRFYEYKHPANSDQMPIQQSKSPFRSGNHHDHHLELNYEPHCQMAIWNMRDLQMWKIKKSILYLCFILFSMEMRSSKQDKLTRIPNSFNSEKDSVSIPVNSLA